MRFPFAAASIVHIISNILNNELLQNSGNILKKYVILVHDFMCNETVFSAYNTIMNKTSTCLSSNELHATRQVGECINADEKLSVSRGIQTPHR